MRDFAQRFPAVGLAAGAAAWAASTQANYALADWACRHNFNPTPYVGLALALVAGFGSALSVLAWRTQPPDASASDRTMAAVSAMAGALFCLVILLQASAGLWLTGCER